MLRLARTTCHFQRLAAAPAAWRASIVAGRALLLLLAAGTLHRAPGLWSTASSCVALVAAAGLPRLLWWLGWGGLAPHCRTLARRASARRASARARALARHAGTLVRVIEIIATIISHLALPIINNRHLAHLALSQKLISQRPN